MKKLLLCTIAVLAMVGFSSCSKEYDDSEIKRKLDDIYNRIAALETTVKQMNDEISSINTIVNALQKNISISKIEQINNGYMILFSDGTSSTITNGTNGEDGSNGKDAPIIGIDKDSDGNYYWTITTDGTQKWLTDKEGDKLSVGGKDGTTPLIKIDSNGFWIVSYDNGKVFTQILNVDNKPISAIGEKGDAGTSDDSFIKNVIVGDEYITIIFNDENSTSIEIPLNSGSGLKTYKETDPATSIVYTVIEIPKDGIDYREYNKMTSVNDVKNLKLKCNANNLNLKYLISGLNIECLDISELNIPIFDRYSDFSSTKIKSLKLPNSLRIIDNSAFSGCSGLTSITIPNGVISIGEWAFGGCTGLTSITIPNSVTSIGEWTFSDCSGLTSIIVDANNQNYTSVDNILYSKDKTTLIYCPIGIKGTITIPNSVTSIRDRVFYGCSGLTSITIPNSVTSIGEWAFSGCSGLTSIIVDANNQNYTSVDNILYSKDKTTLIYCPIGIKGTITIPNSVTSIGDMAFNGCSGLLQIQCEAVKPPFGNGIIPNNSCKLKVPAGSVELYKNANGWKDFRVIEAI